MSYDIYLTIDTGGPEPATVHEVGNMTSNVSGMWRLALDGISLAELHGQECGECIPLLVRAVEHMRDPANTATYEAMNPANGWGNHESATRYLNNLLNACRAHPKATIDISR